MTLGTTNLSMSALQTEFGGSNPISLSEYVRGGLYVPSGQTSTYGTIPTSNSNISLGLFRGVTKVSSGATMTVGIDSTNVAGGKGTAAYHLFSYGYSQSGGTFQDTENYYNISYAAMGSISGVVGPTPSLGFTIVDMTWQDFQSEDSNTGYYERLLRIVVQGNIGQASGGQGSYGNALTPYVNGSAIAGAKAGEWGGAGPGGTLQTVFTWRYGTRPNTGGTLIAGADASTPSSNPFGAFGSTATVDIK